MGGKAYAMESNHHFAHVRRRHACRIFNETLLSLRSDFEPFQHFSNDIIPLHSKIIRWLSDAYTCTVTVCMAETLKSLLSFLEITLLTRTWHSICVGHMSQLVCCETFMWKITFADDWNMTRVQVRPKIHSLKRWDFTRPSIPPTWSRIDIFWSINRSINTHLFILFISATISPLTENMMIEEEYTRNERVNWIRIFNGSKLYAQSKILLTEK